MYYVNNWYIFDEWCKRSSLSFIIFRLAKWRKKQRAKWRSWAREITQHWHMNNKYQITKLSLWSDSWWKNALLTHQTNKQNDESECESEWLWLVVPLCSPPFPTIFTIWLSPKTTIWKAHSFAIDEKHKRHICIELLPSLSQFYLRFCGMNHGVFFSSSRSIRFRYLNRLAGEGAKRAREKASWSRQWS